MPGLSRKTSPTENDGRLSNWLRSIVVWICPLGAWNRFARASLGVTRTACDAAGVATMTLGLARARTDERTLGRRATGFAAVARGASTVTGGNAVWARMVEGVRQSALQSTSRLALQRAR
jgi:hypothetical protein